jgi:hypothetical protein
MSYPFVPSKTRSLPFEGKLGWAPPGLNARTLFKAVIYRCSYKIKSRVFVSGWPFRSSLIFIVKARDLP